MSFLEKIREKKKQLSHTITTVTTLSGDVYIEEVARSKMPTVVPGLSRYGFVVDTKPDFQIAKVLPGLFMGSQDVTQNVDLLKENNVTHILSVGMEVDKLEGFSYHFVQAFDLPGFNIRRLFDQCFALIDSVREEGGSIYVHCNQGISRSATVVIAYLMKEVNMTYEDALNYLRAARPVVNPNVGFVNQLHLFEKELND